MELSGLGLLEFARGPALKFSLAVFVLGSLWRLIGVLMLRWEGIPSAPREGAPAPFIAAIGGIFSKMIPHRTFLKSGAFSIINGYVFHLGLAIAVLLFAPHVLFIKSTTGLSWPTLPSNVIYMVSALTAFSLVAALVHRLTNPVQRLISRVNDYVTWLVTFLPVATGLMAVSHIGARYETLLAWHILSICLFFLWFPFGKLMHAFFFALSRSASAVRFKHRGAQI